MKKIEKRIDFSEFDFDVLELKDAEKYETELAKVREKMALAEKNVIYSKLIIEECNAVYEFFNNVLGEGTSKKLFGNSVHLSHVITFRQFVEYATAQIADLAKTVTPKKTEK